MGRRYERKKYGATLLALPVWAVDKPPWPSTGVIDHNPTGSFTSPSWTHASMGINQAFVAADFSSSYQHDLHTLNLFRSGTQGVENTPVPASATLLFAKTTRLQTIVVKHTASFFDTIPGPSGTYAPSTFSPLTGCLMSVVTGTNMGTLVSCPDRPAQINVSVPVSGRLVDIKVWIELTQLSGSGGRYFPLGILGVALRSPNVSWGHAHPIRNDPKFLAPWAVGFYYPPSFFRDTFLLWEGGSMGANDYTDFGAAQGTDTTPGDAGPWQQLKYESGAAGVDTELARYPTWQRDRGMRTVFSDGAVVPNPRHLYTPTSPSGNWIGSPNVGKFGSFSGGTVPGIAFAAYGFDVPWTSDVTSLASTDPNVYTGAGSPPTGWLSGLGQSANVNEWPTTGSNYGTPSIRPVYPLLDPIFGHKLTGTEKTNAGDFAGFFAPLQIDQWKGFRPGLRGTEISGTWNLLVSTNWSGGVQTGSVDTYFRQVRLEITYETPPSASPAKTRRSQTSFQPRRSGSRFLYGISGSDFGGFASINGADADYFRTDVYGTLPQDCETGRTFGLVMNSGTFNPSQYALIYRLTGSYLAQVSGSAPSWLTSNMQGMPAIPFSSASLQSPTVTPQLQVPVPTGVAPVNPGAFISPNKVLDGARQLSNVAEDTNPAKSLRAIAETFVSTATKTDTED